MRKISRSALVPYSAEQMYVLVEDVESYPDFLPWCGGAVLHWRDGDLLEGSVEMHLAGLRRSFRTRNTMREFEAIDMEHVASTERGAQDVSLDVEFEVKSQATDRLLGRYFEQICNSLVDAFVRRAEDIYGGGGTGNG